MKKLINKNWIWLLAVALILCVIPAAHILAKTVEAQEAETIFFYVTNADGKDILVKAAPIEEIRALSHQKSEGVNYAVSSLDSLPTTCYAEAQGFTTGELIQYLNNNGYNMGALTYEGQDRMYFMADDSGTIWTRNYTAEKLNDVQRRYVEGLYAGWELFYDDWTWLEDLELEHEETLAYKAVAWSEGEDMPPILSTLSNSGRTTTNVSETSEGILDYVIANGGSPRGCLKDYLNTEKALTLYIPTSEEQFMKGIRTCSENFKWIYAIRLKMANLPAIASKGTVPAAKPTYELTESGGKTLLTVTLNSPMDGTTIYYNDGQDVGRSAQTKYKDPFTIDVTGINLSTNPIKYYTRTVREGYDDLGPLTMQYYQVAPAFQSVSAGSPLGEDVAFTANTRVTPEEWTDWTGQITKVTLGYPGGTSKNLTNDEYQIDNDNKTITLIKDLFTTTGSHSLTFEASGYATRKISRTMKGITPEVTMAAAGYPMYEDIVLTFVDATRAYQANITVKIDGKTVPVTYLERTEPGKLNIKANYFATGALNQAGEYTLALSNSNYLPNEQTLTLKIIPGLAGEEPPCQDGVYLLADADDLFWFAKQVNVKGIKDIKARLTGDIDLNNAPWTPIGISSSIVYSGTFDGNGHQISGLNVNSEENYQGLFGYVKDATIKNLTVSGQVKGKGWTGGIVGTATNLTIDNCVNKATVQGTVNTGGIAGNASLAGLIQNCCNKGSVSGTQYVGGICGQTASTTFVQNCVNYGRVHGANRVGGITGANAGIKDGLSVDRCVNSGEVSANDNNVGGISGYVQKLVSNCYNRGTVLGNKNDNSTGIGGIGGYVVYGGQVTNCYNIGLVSCTADAPITRTGAVAGSWGSNLSSANNYYLQNDAIGGIGHCSGTAPDDTGSKTVAEMKALAPTLGDDFVADTYLINNGYPVLTWQFAIAKANQDTADEVIRLISAIGEVDAGDTCRERIAAAREAFDFLTEDQQLLVTNRAALTAAEAAYAAAVENLAMVKTAAKNELDSYKNPADYRKTQQAELAAAIAAGKTAIDAATDTAGVNKAMADAKAAMDKIKTDAQLTAEELAAVKTAAKNELDRYKYPADYRKAQQAELAAAIAAGKTAINAAADTAGVNKALADAKAAMDKIKTDAQLRDLPRTGGAYPVAIWLVIVSICLTGLACFLRKRRTA